MVIGHSWVPLLSVESLPHKMSVRIPAFDIFDVSTVQRIQRVCVKEASITVVFV